jgi:translation initiation factor IF-3
LRVNEAIRAREVRVVGDDGQQLGVLSVREALEIARSRGLDLVEVAPNADPPVCRVLDFGKFIYEKTKKEKEARRAQKQVEIKEVRMRPKTGTHDVDFKLRDARRFLLAGSKVRVRVRFRGSEITHPEVARGILEKVAVDLADIASVEQHAAMDGNSLLIVLAPLQQKA